MILKTLRTCMILALCFGFRFVGSKSNAAIKCESKLDGVCTRMPDCNQAVEEVERNGFHTLDRCGFRGFVEIVCCPTPTLKIRKSVRFCMNYEQRIQKVFVRRTARPQTPIIFKQISNRTVRSTEELTFTIETTTPSETVRGGVDVTVLMKYFKTTITEYSHVVALGFYDTANQVYKFDCGGTLISDKYVITAAHCIANIEGNELKVVRVGIIEVPLEPVTIVDLDLDYKVKRFIVHPNFTRRRNIHDIALVELEKEVGIKITPACLYTREEEPSQMQIAGWGAVNETGERSKIMQKANVTSIPIQQCINRFRNTGRYVGNTQICAQDVNSDTCEGDSGGPLQVQDENTQVFKLVGITSFGFGCFGGLPGVYTKIFSYLDWIEEIVWP